MPQIRPLPVMAAELSSASTEHSAILPVLLYPPVRQRRFTRRSRERGVALLMVLFALALIALGLPVLLEQSRAEVDRLQGLHDERQAQALHRGIQLLVEEGLTQRRWRQSALYSQTLQGQWLDLSMMGEGAGLLPEADIRFRLRDKRGCYNVNALAGQQAEQARRQLSYLLRTGGRRLSDMGPEQLVDRLADWVDADDQRRKYGAESRAYLAAKPAYLPSQAPLVDASELNLLQPADSERVWRYPEFCVLVDTGPWRLNLNALTPEQLPLLEALYLGEVSSSTLQRLLLQRPQTGYANADDVREVLSGVDAAQINRILERLMLNSNYYRLETEISLNGVTYAYHHDLLAQGVSRWAAQVPAQRIIWQARQRPL